MNGSYKLVYSASLDTWVPVSEHVSARGKKSVLRCVTVAVLVAGGFAGVTSAQTAPPRIAPPAVTQLPTGAQVAAGTVAFSQTQTANAATLVIQQSSNQAIVNWQSFAVGANARVNITQPSHSSVLLNRVQSSDPSPIFGQINANGQVLLVNPQGIYFAPGSRVDVGSLTATTGSISDADFLSGQHHFHRQGAYGSILNEGHLSAGLGGYIALLAPEVRNQGVVVAQRGGTVALAAGESYQLQFNSNKQLTQVLVTPATIQALVDNGNAVQAPGGLIILSAQAAHGLLGGVVKNSGAVSATGLVNDGGTIRLIASDKIELAQTSRISADAAPGSAGHGGRIDIIADLTNATSRTQVDGSISAQGGDLGGDGGFVETSATNLNVRGSTRVSTLAPSGRSGEWLLDPTDFTIAATGGDITGATLTANLNAGSVTIASSGGSTGTRGDIHVYDDVSWSANTLTLNAGYNINVGSSTRTGSLTVTGAGALVLNPSSSSVPGYTANGMVLMGMASAPTGGPNGNGFNGSIHLSATDATRLLDSSSSPVLKISGNPYTIIKTLGSSSDYSTSSNNYTLQGMAASNNVGGGKYFALGNDIDAAATSTWTNLNGGLGFFPIGKQAGNFAGGCDCRFSGVFDGLGHAVKDLYEYRPNLDQYNRGNVGLIAYALGSSRVANIGVTGNMSGQTAVGGLVAAFDSTSYSLPQIANSYSAVNLTVLNATSASTGGLAGTAGHIVNSYSTGNVTATGVSNVGGLVGTVPNYGTSKVLIDQSYATGQVSGASNVGGLIGYISPGNTNTVSQSYATGRVIGTGSGVGGLIGDARDISVSSSYATGAVSGVGNVGGLMGSFASSSSKTVTGSYATGSVSGTGNSVGGLIGDARGVTVSSSYATGAVTGSTFVGGLVGFSQPVTVTDSYATGNVSLGGSNGGGLVGYVYGGSITSSYASGNISGQDVGGLTGTAQTNVSITRSYASGNVTLTSATGNAGGLIAYLPGTTAYSISDNYASGTVSQTGGSSGTLGGLIGLGSGRSFSNNYWNSTKNPARSTTTGGVGGSSTSTSGITAITTTEMSSASGFSSAFGNSGGVFTVASGWGYARSVNGGFPILCALTTCTSYRTSNLYATFVGSTNGLWSLASNWDIGYAPSASNSATIDAVVINAGSSVHYDTGSAGSVSNAIQNAGHLTFTGASDVTVSGPISGAGSVTLSGSGTVTLSGANTYTGATTVSAGTLQVGAGGTSGSLASDIANNASLIFNRSDSLTYAGVISGTGAVNKSGAGTLTLSGANTYTGGTTVSAGTLQVGAGSTTGSIAGNVVNNATLAFHRSDALIFDGVISGTGAVTKLGSGSSSVTTLSGSNTYSGGTTVSAGTLKVGHAGALGDSTGAVSVTNGAALDLNGTTITQTHPLTLNGTGVSSGGALTNSSSTAGLYTGPVVLASAASVGGSSGDITVGGVISGGFALTKVGSDTVTLTAANTYSGGTTLSAGTLQIGAGGTTGSITGNVGNSGVLDFNRSNDLTYSGVISGTGSVRQSGAGTTTFAGSNAYSGGTTISAGTLARGATGAFGTGTVTVAGGTADLRGAAVSNNFVLGAGGPQGALTSSTTGDIDLSGTISLSAPSSIGGAVASNIVFSNSVTSNGHGLVLLDQIAKSFTSTSNTLSTLASGPDVGSLHVVNNQALTLGQVVLGGTTYSGISSTGTVRVSTRTGDLTVSQNVATTSTSSSSSAPAIDLRAGTLAAAGTVTGGDLVLIGTPTFTMGANGLAVFYSGHSSTPEAFALIDKLSVNSPFSKVYNQASSTNIAGTGYWASLRGSAPVDIYVLPESGQSSIYGTAPTTLSYCYSSSASSCVSVSYSGIPSTPQSFALGSGAVSGTVNVASGVAGTLALSGSPSIAGTGLVATTNAGTYALRLTPSLSLSGYAFSAGHSVNYTVNRKPVTLTNIARTTTYDGASYAALATGTGFSVGAMVGSDAVASVSQTPSGMSGAASSTANMGSFTVTPSAAVMGAGTASNYDFSYGGSTHTISPASLTITASTNSKSFDGTTSSQARPVVSGLQGSDTVSNLTQAYADANAGTGKTLSVQSGYQLADGNNGNNYTVTLVSNQTGEIRSQTVAVLPPTLPVAPLGSGAPPTLTVAALGGMGASTGASTGGGGTAASSSAGVSVSTINAPSVQVSGLVAVQVPAGTATAGSGLVIALPEPVVAPAAKGVAVHVTLANREPLPAWIRYDATSQTLLTSAVPAGAFPLSVLVTVGGQSTVVQISESTASP